MARNASRSRLTEPQQQAVGRKPTLSLYRNMVKGAIGLGLTVKAGKENSTKDVTW